ncbi:hypothetical protein FACS1894200_01270 [Spirochaetia bacterium]|nr:hypothetical protein FACS1894200_01270 [Spirochaetia bacterium]
MLISGKKMGSNYQNIFYKDYECEVEQNKKLKGENRELKQENKLLVQRNETQAQQIVELTTQYKKQLEEQAKQLEEQAKQIKEQQKEIERLKSQLNSNETNSGMSAGAAALNETLNAEQQKEIEHLKSLLNTDGTNSGTPTSKTAPNKNKKIPNTRKKTDKHRGGQKKHPKHKLKRFEDDKVTKQVEHPLEKCPKCHNELKGPVKETIEKDVLDIEVLINKIRHLYHVYYCPRCRKLVHEAIPNELKEENQYGPNVQALALVLMIIGHVSMNKVRKIIKGLSRGEINISEGFLVKLQRRASGRLKGFIAGLRNLILQQTLLFWDDTVIMIDKARACLRFYGTQLLALYKTHAHKDKAGLDKDNILNLLPDTTIVVHDHNKVNYNKDYSFQNAQCAFDSGFAAGNRQS